MKQTMDNLGGDDGHYQRDFLNRCSSIACLQSRSFLECEALVADTFLPDVCLCSIFVNVPDEQQAFQQQLASALPAPSMNSSDLPTGWQSNFAHFALGDRRNAGFDQGNPQSNEDDSIRGWPSVSHSDSSENDDEDDWGPDYEKSEAAKNPSQNTFAYAEAASTQIPSIYPQQQTGQTRGHGSAHERERHNEVRARICNPVFATLMRQYSTLCLAPYRRA